MRSPRSAILLDFSVALGGFTWFRGSPWETPCSAAHGSTKPCRACFQPSHCRCRCWRYHAPFAL